MDVTLPSTVNINVFKAYIHDANIKYSAGKSLNAVDLKWDSKNPKTLRTIILDTIIQNWHEKPVLSEIPKQVDKNYILENLDVNLPIKILSKHIMDDIFWNRCFHSRWPSSIPEVNYKKWICAYMEKDLTEMLEILKPSNYDPEEMQTILEIASPYIEELRISCLQPSMGEKSDHIPFDLILSNLPELKQFGISYIAKNVGTNFYLACSSMSSNDAVCLWRGLQKTYDLREFCLFSTKLDFAVVQSFAKSLEKGCPNLVSLNLTNCWIGDNGLKQFVLALNMESFVYIKKLILVNNFFSQESALLLSRIIQNRPIEYFDLSLNPIGSEGAATILSVISRMPMRTLNLRACSVTDSIGRLLLKLIVENKNLFNLNIANNELGNDLGVSIYKIIGFNKVLKSLDLRSSNISTRLRRDINNVLFENRDKL